MIWDLEGSDYSVLRDRAEYHLMKSGKCVGTYPGLKQARFAAESAIRQAEALAEFTKQRERLKQVAAARMGVMNTKEGR